MVSGAGRGDFLQDAASGHPAGEAGASVLVRPVRGVPISCKRWCCDVCEDFGARANPVNRARIPSRARPLADQLTQLLTRISFETTV